VSALDTEMVEYMDQTVGCRKICLCHDCTSFYDQTHPAEQHNAIS
jgi:hypothetical protein